MTKLFATLLSLVALGATLLVIASPGAAVTAQAARTKSVAVKDDHFTPKTITIRKGGVVKWVWKGHNKHNVVLKGHRSSLKRRGSYKVRFRHKGNFFVYCSVHVDLGMTMRVHVK